MLISRVSEEEGDRVGDVEQQTLENNSTEYQTADELFEIIAKDHPFKIDGDNKLTTRDLVILYQNIDIGTKLVPNSDVLKPNLLSSKCPNQYVETIIYNDEPESEDSDISENISNEDLNDVFMINKERIDLFNNIGDRLCHKFGNINMQTSNLTTDYGKHFIFENQFMKQQFKSFHTISNSKLSDSTILPASLLDYICCNRLEDNYNFYMDNIIKYVQHTIEQLKRISNGDYLTERAKEKWREVDGDIDHISDCKKIVLASSTSIPLHVVGKLNRHKSTWDDIVHSEMDVRSLSKILEKKIIVEVPKILCGSFRLFSTHKENLIITCKKRKHIIRETKEKESRVDVVLKLQRSKSGHVISNIDSIMILKSSPDTESCSKDILELEFEQATNHEVEQKAKIVELDDNIEEISQHAMIENDFIVDQECKVEEISEPYLTSDISRQYICDEQTETNFDVLAADDLRCTLHRLNRQSPVLEEGEDNNKKKKSPTRVRIKSPYENQSHFIEDKKRKKLLEIREKREKKKVAMSENCKITKQRYGRGAVMAQSSNSVTKLSITNKSFYNSIYGHAVNINNKSSKFFYKDQKMECIPPIKLEHNDEDDHKDISSLTTPEKNSQKYINRSYYLDEADTEIMYLQSPVDESRNDIKDSCTPSTSALFTNDVGVNLNLLKQLIGTSTTEFSLTDTSSSLQENIVFEDNFINNGKMKTENKAFTSILSTQVLVPTNTPKKESADNESCKITSTIECKRSIDKIYKLINNNGKANCDLKCIKSKLANNIDKLDLTARRGSSTVQISDSGTSIKHQLTSSNPSCFSFEKTNIENKPQKDSKKKHDQSTSVIPKVIISSKLQNNKNENAKINNKENKRHQTPCKVSENPLKAISQLLHEFDSIQKTRHKNLNELKRNRKPETTKMEDRNNTKQTCPKRTPKQDQHSNSSLMLKERRRHGLSNEPSRIPHQELQNDENYAEKTGRKKISDIIDEVKELRGEAVRGPSKKLSRLNSLAQPKKAYIQAHHDNVQNRFGKRIVERLQKPPTIAVSVPERNIGSINLRNKQRKGLEGFPASTNNLHIVGQQPLEKSCRTKRSRHNSPSNEGKRSPMPGNKPSYNNSNVKNSPEIVNGKMVAVETYVKNHFGRVIQAQKPIDNYVHKSRVPLIPIDIDVASLTSSRSVEESSVLGKKLHYMIDSMVNTNAPVLSALTECNESTSKFDTDNPEDILTEDLSKNEEVVSRSDYPVDVFQDKNIITAVSTICKNDKYNEEANENYKNINVTMSETTKSCTTNELQQLENALYRQISNSVFQKRLRIKNLTLTPKQSIDNVFILPSGDTASVVVKSTLSQKNISKTDNFSELTILPVLSNKCIDFGFTKLPMHIATVGYAFAHHLVTSHSLSDAQNSNNEDFTQNNLKNYKINHFAINPKFNKSIQCFKGADEKIPQDTINESTCVAKDTDIRNEHITKCKGILNEPENIQKKNEVKDLETEIIHGDKIDVKSKNSDNISNSTSLDILVGLLNEIKKITSHQADLTKIENTCNIDFESKELEIILDKAAVKESSVDHSINNGISITSFDNLQDIETSSSKYYVNLSSNVEEYQDNPTIHKDITTSISLPYGILSVDKEINASLQIYQKEYVHRFTEVPSQFFPVTVSTNVTDSLITLINKSSRHSVYSFNDCRSSNNSIPNLSNEMSINNTEKCNHPTLKIQYLRNKNNNRDVLKRNLIERNTNVAVAEFDPIMKMKRDILVTVYSILVLTVFAALSFPELAYYV